MKKFWAVLLIISFGSVFILDVHPIAPGVEDNEEWGELSLATAIQNLRLSYHYEIKWPENSAIPQYDTGQFVHYGYYNYETLKEGYFTNRENAADQGQIRQKPKVSDRKIEGEFFAGLAGSVAFGFIGLFAGFFAPLSYNEDDGLYDRFFSGLFGSIAGLMFGSAIGVTLAGNSRNVKGSFGKALLGAALGEVVGFAFFILCLSLNEFEKSSPIAYGALFTLPTIGAMIFFNRSLKYRTLPGNALLNLDKGKFNIGIPYVQVQPRLRFAANEKMSFMMNVNLVNINF